MMIKGVPRAVHWVRYAEINYRSRQTIGNYSQGMPPLAHHLESIRNQGTSERSGLGRLLAPSSAPPVEDWEEGDLDEYLSFCERVLCPDGRGGEMGERISCKGGRR